MKTAIGILVAAALTVLIGSHYWRTSAKPKFRTAEVTRGDLSITATATGTVEPVAIVEVGAQIIGSITKFAPDKDQPGKTIDFCSQVTAGDLLAELDDAPYKLERQKAEFDRLLAEAELNKAKATCKQKRQNHARAQELNRQSPGSISRQDLETAESEHEVAQAEVKMAENKVELMKNAEDKAEVNLRYTKIYSPVDGVVISRKVNVGQTVVSGMNTPVLFLLAKDISHMLVRATVNEADIGAIREGQKVTFTVSSNRDRQYTGRVSQIRFDATLINSVVMYDVIIDVDNTDGTLKPYLTAKVNFQVDERKDVLRVPDQALRWRPTRSQVSRSALAELATPYGDVVKDAAQSEEGADDAEPKIETAKPTVWIVANDGLVRPVTVTTGLSDGIRTEITGGAIEPGEMVVAGATEAAEADFVNVFVKKATSKN